MFFKLLIAVLISGILILQASCTPKVGEQPPPTKSQEMNNTQCMSDASRVAKEFVLGKAANADLAAGWDCLSMAFEKFHKYVRGQNKDYYTSQELADFIEQNFFEQDTKTGKAKNPISPALQLEFMKFKQIFVGGQREHVTRDEVLKSIQQFQNFKRLTLRINPYMKVLTLNWKPSRFDSSDDNSFFEQANFELQYFAREISGQIQKNDQKYVIDDFAAFMRELARFYNEDWEINPQIEKFLPLAKKLKKAIAGGSEDEVAPEEWKSFILLGARGYVQYLRYTYFIKTAPETGSAIRLAYLARSTEDAFSAFQDLVSIKPGGVVTRTEFRDTLVAFSKAWPDFKISDGLVSELMKIKRLMLGGSVDSWSSVDFETAKLKVARLKAIVERFLPYYDVYGLSWNRNDLTYDQAIRYFNDAQVGLELSTRELGSLLESTYNMQDVLSFVHEIELLYPPDGGESWEISVAKYLPLMKDAKNIVYADDSVIKKDQWSSLLGFSSRIFTDFLFFQYFLKDQDLSKRESLLSLSQFSNQTLDLLRDLLAQKSEHIISVVELNRLALRFKELGLVPQELKPQSIDELIRAIVNSILISPERRISGVVPNGVDSLTIEVFRKEFQVWVENEIFLVEIYASTGQDAMLPQDLRNVVAQKLKNSTISANLREGLSEFQMEIDTPVALDIDSETRLRISNRVGHYYNLASARNLNLTRLMARVLVRSFGKDIERIRTYAGINLEEAHAGFSQVSPVFVDLKYLDSASLAFIDNRFREANIFMPHSNGDDLVSFYEAAELVNMIFSGVKLDSLLRNDLLKECLANNAPPSTNETLVSVKCVKKVYKRLMPNAFASMPEYVRFISKIDDDEFSTAFYNSVKAAGYKPNDKGLARLGDISLFPHVIQYSEMLMARFDADMDGGINTQEAIRAFPSFITLFKQLAKDQLASGTIKEKDLLALFTFVLKYGHAPTGLWEGITKWLPWKDKDPSQWNVWADRSQVATILGYIADQSSKTLKTDLHEALTAGQN